MTRLSGRSHLVLEVVKSRDAFLETLSLSDLGDEFASLAIFVEWVSIELLPMIEHALWESTAGSGCSEGLSETEGLSDWQVGLHVHEWSSGDGLFSDDDTSALREALVDTANCIIWALDLDKVDWLNKSWGSC